MNRAGVGRAMVGLLEEDLMINEKEAQECAAAILRLPGKIGKVLRRTYLVMGDEAEIADSEALEEIRRIVEGIDPRAVEQP
jgi:hypothetical protein